MRARTGSKKYTFSFSFEANIRLLALELKAVSIWSYVLSRDANSSRKHTYSSFTLVQLWAAPLQCCTLRGLCEHQHEGERSLFLEPHLPPQLLMGEFDVTGPWEARSSSGLQLCGYYRVSTKLCKHCSPDARIFSLSLWLAVLQSLRELFNWWGAHAFATKTILCRAALTGEICF